MGIALEADLGRRVDAVLAVAMLNGFVSKAEARSIAFCVSRSNVATAQFADVIAGFYAPRPAGGSAMIGMPDGGSSSEDPPVASAVLSKKSAEDAPLYTSNIKRPLDTPDNAVLIRNMLLAQNDENATIVVAGPLTGLARLLGLYGSRPQIVAKVKRVVIAAGAFPAGPAEATIKSDLASARTVFAEWPTSLVVVGSEVGAALPYPGSSIDADFSWSPAHPVADAYRAFGKMPYDAPATALAAMLHAVHADDGYFKLSDPGTITVQDDGRTQFTPGPDGKHRYLIVDPAQQDRVTKMYTDMVSAKPAQRGGRGRGGT